MANRLLSEFPPLQSLSSPRNSSHDERPICSRDFFKFCDRVSNLDVHNEAEKLFLDAIDCFICSQPAGGLRNQLAIVLGGLFNFTADQATHIWKNRRPELNLDVKRGRVEAGRTFLKCKRSIQWELQLAKYV